VIDELQADLAQLWTAGPPPSRPPRSYSVATLSPPYARSRRVTHPRTRSAALAAANAELTSGTATPRRAATARAMAPHRGAGRFDGLEGGHSEQASTRRSALFGRRAAAHR